MVPRWARCLLTVSMLVLCNQAKAGLVTISSSDPMIAWPTCPCHDPLPGVTPLAIFDYAGQPSLVALKSMELTMTLGGGDTGLGQLDHNKLSFSLDGIDTGLKLNGFSSDGFQTQTFHWDASQLSTQVATDILAGLVDKQLFAAINDATPNDNFASMSSAYTTTLKLTGEVFGGNGDPVPEPLSLLAWSMCLGGGYSLRRRCRPATV